MYSLTQAGSLGQMFGLFLIFTGLTQEQAEAGVAALYVLGGILTHVVAFGTAWYGRYRRGDITIFGFRKQ